jgi:hypothetical protein
MLGNGDCHPHISDGQTDGQTYGQGRRRPEWRFQLSVRDRKTGYFSPLLNFPFEISVLRFFAVF